MELVAGTVTSKEYGLSKCKSFIYSSNGLGINKKANHIFSIHLAVIFFVCVMNVSVNKTSNLNIASKEQTLFTHKELPQ